MKFKAVVTNPPQIFEERTGEKVSRITGERGMFGACATPRKRVRWRKKETQTRGEGKLAGGESERRRRRNASKPEARGGVRCADKGSKSMRSERVTMRSNKRRFNELSERALKARRRRSR